MKLTTPNLSYLVMLFGLLVFSFSCTSKKDRGPVNLAKVATISHSSGYRSPSSFIALYDGIIPDTSSIDRENAFIGWSRDSVYYLQYEWTRPVSTNIIILTLWDNNDRIKLPASYEIQYKNGDEYVALPGITTYKAVKNRPDTLRFDAIETRGLRLVLERDGQTANGILEWDVISSGNTLYPPIVEAGQDREVMIGGKTYLMGKVRAVGNEVTYTWKKKNGPGEVTFNDVHKLETSATFSALGAYELILEASDENQISTSKVKVQVSEPPPAKRLDVVYTKPYKVDSKLWNDRVHAMIVNWIPHCIDQINRTDLEKGQGGIDNFIEAAKALRGEPHDKHKGYVFSNAWVYQTVEAMSIALMIDPQGDKEMINAQNKFRRTLDDWIPKILAAQEPDGYIQTAYTLRDTSRWHHRWEPEHKETHEGYVAGYFIESAINHYTLTKGKDLRLYNAAKKMADCWVHNIGPGKKPWYDGHQEMEQALVRFGRFVNDMEGNGKGDDYISLAKFLLDNRGGGDEYDQSHVPVQKQYEAVGHAVRAVYSYSGMADVAAETGDTDYQSAVKSLWNNIVEKKYYVTGGIGSGETSEGFGPNYSLRNNAYCESCSSCGLIFFQYKMNMAYHDAKYADLYEETLYNALLGSLDAQGKNFYYTNPLTSNEDRSPWHVCPCCVGNIPRTLLMLPTWTYLKSENAIYINLFIGSTMTVENVNDTDVELVQKTNYPWDGKVEITVNPKENKEFTLYIRVPNRKTSVLYSATPRISGIKSLQVNGKTVPSNTENGYVAIKKQWQKGDQISFELPMEIQVITGDDRIEATKGKMALRYGPLVYNVERADQSDITHRKLGSDSLSLEWNPDLFNGIMTIKGTWDDETGMTAIPNYVRNNRMAEGNGEDANSIVWINKE